MKRFSRITFGKRDVGEDVFEKASLLLPENEFETSIHVRLHEADPRLDELLLILKRSGCVQHKRGERPPKYYTVIANYEYEPADIEAASYLHPVSGHDFRGFYRADSGVLLLERKTLRTKTHLVNTGSGDVDVVSSDFRQVLESSGLLGLDFKPTQVYNGHFPEKYQVFDWEEIPRHDAYWELSPTVELPAVSPGLKLIRMTDGAPATRGDNEHGLSTVEDRFPGGELHYLRSEMSEVEPFDVALTRESFGNGYSPDDRRLVVSKRFKQICDKMNLPVDWYPVYVDDE